ncbi:MAG TPA: heme biosynthesis HemY N-terminal domain-containing protein [Gammaproteobacteria bacterium]
MRLGLWGITAVFLGAFLAHFILRDRGYVLINYSGYVIEMSVPALVVVLMLLYIGVRALVAVWRAPRRLGEAIAESQVRRSGVKLTRGLIHIAEGDWAKGERLLTQGLRGTDAPLINYLLAARAAQLQGSDERRDDWLRLAYEELPNAETAVLLTQAELRLEHGEYERALATLNRIQESHPNHPVALGLLAKTHRALEDWNRLIELLPSIGSAKLDAEDLENLTAEALAVFNARGDLTFDQLEKLWGELPAKLRSAPRLIALRAVSLGSLGRGDLAAKEIRNALKRNWHEDLVIAFGKIETSDPAKQLKRAEQWLKAHPEDGALLLTAARLCMGVELWGKARSYLESSLAMQPRTDAYALYGRLLKQLGEDDSAALAFRSGLALVTGAVEEVPALDAPIRSAAAVDDAADVASRSGESGASPASR